jgi:hypothetical protein
VLRPADAKLRALSRWAAAFERRSGQPASAWLDQLCEDPSLTAAQRLAHMPARVPRARKLLLLCGPTVPQRLWCVAELYAWHAMGGIADAIKIVPVLPHGGASAAELADASTKIVAAIDSFHVMYSEAHEQSQHATLTRSVEMATVARYNELVCGMTPAVRNACAAASDSPVRRSSSCSSS